MDWHGLAQAGYFCAAPTGSVFECGAYHEWFNASYRDVPFDDKLSRNQMRFADALIAVFVVLAFVVPILHDGSRESLIKRLISILRFWVVFLCAVGISVALAKIGKQAQVWPNDSGFPSAHQAFAAAATVCLARLKRRWLIFLCLLLLSGMALALIAAKAHDLREVLGGAAIGLFIASSFCYAMNHKRTGANR